MDGRWEIIMSDKLLFRLPILAALLWMGLSVLFSSKAFAQENLVFNGTFDLEVPSNGTGGGWTSTHLATSGWVLETGNYFFVLNGVGNAQIDPNIEQSLTGLDVGETYLIKGEYRNYHGVSWCDTSAYSFGVEVDGQKVLELKYLSGTFSPFEASFVALATEQTIRFSAEINGSDCDYAIDNIQVYTLNKIFKDGFEGTSVLSCTDLVLNQDETDIDCGGAVCAPCSIGNACIIGSDCLSGDCSNEGLCQ